MIKNTKLRAESLVATLLSFALLLIFSVDIVEWFVKLGDLVMNRSEESIAAIKARQAEYGRVTVKEHLEGIKNWKMAMSIVPIVFFAIYLWSANSYMRKYRVERRAGAKTFWGTVLMIMSTYAVTFVVFGLILQAHVVAISYAYSASNEVYITVTWILGIVLGIAYIVLLFINGNQMLEEADDSLCTGLGIGESIYSNWVEWQKYKVSLTKRVNNISTYISNPQYL